MSDHEPIERDEAPAEADPEREALRALRAFLERTSPDEAGRESDSGVGLYQLVEAFTALRQDIKLQARDVRNLSDRAETAVEALHAAQQRFDAAQERERGARETSGNEEARAFARALTDLDESLERSLSELERARAGLESGLADRLAESIEARQHPRSPWDRLRPRLGRDRIAAAAREALSAESGRLERVVEGQRLMHERLRRAMAERGLRRIACVGELVDPHCMRVVAADDAPGARPDEVTAEVRPGYWWNDALLRPAEVRAARAAADTARANEASGDTDDGNDPGN